MDNKIDFPINNENIAAAIEALRSGKPILLLDDSDRENEGDLVLAAQNVSPEQINFLIRKGSGVVCLALPKSRLEELEIPMMVPENTNSFKTAFTVSIEAKKGITTGVSAFDRSQTIKVAMDDTATPRDIARPGHLFPLAAQKNGVFGRMGHTEGSVDLVKIAGLKPGAVLCELMNEDGTMTVGKDREDFAKKHNIPIVTVSEILHHRIRHDKEIVLEKSDGILSLDTCGLKWHHFKYCTGHEIYIIRKKSQNTDIPNYYQMKLQNIKNHLTYFINDTSDNTRLQNFLLDLRNLKANEYNLLALIFEPTGNAELLGKNITDALLCRALLELNIDKIKNPPENLNNVANKNFGISLS